jgi:hypothetical protein
LNNVALQPKALVLAIEKCEHVDAVSLILGINDHYCLQVAFNQSLSIFG